MHAADATAAAQSEEVERLRKGASSHVAALRRHKTREQHLEDAVLALKQQVEACQAERDEAQASAKRAKSKSADASRRASAAEASQKAAEAELAASAQDAASAREELRASLTQMQDASCDALRNAQDAAQLQVAQLTEQLRERDDDAAELREQLHVQMSQAAGASADEGGASELRDVVKALRQRNHELQLALAQRPMFDATEPQVRSRGYVRLSLGFTCPVHPQLCDDAHCDQVLEGTKWNKVVQTLALAGQHALDRPQHTPQAAVEELRDDIVRLTERLVSVVATNAELLRERSEMSTRMQVRLDSITGNHYTCAALSAFFYICSILACGL